MDSTGEFAYRRRVVPGLHAASWARSWGCLALGSSGIALMMQYVDRPLAQYFAVHAGATFQLASFLTRFGDALWWLLPSLVLFLAARFIWRSPVWAARALFVFTSVAVCGILVDLIKLIAGRARPELWLTHGIYGFSYPHLQSVYQSFPSGHAACASGAAVALSLLFPRHRPLWVAVGAAVGLSRVIVTAHYLSDVVAAGLLAALIVLELRRTFVRHGLALGTSGSAGGVRLHSLLAARIVGGAVSAAPATAPAWRPPRAAPPAAAARVRRHVQAPA